MSTSVYKNATCWTYYFDQESADKLTCEVRLSDEGEITIHDDENIGAISYRGKELGDGHYQLKSDIQDGRASLHRFPDGEILEGYWEQSCRKGMWRIELGEISDTVSGMETPESDDADEEADDWDEESMDDEPSQRRSRTKRPGDVSYVEEEEDDEYEEPLHQYYRFPLREDEMIRLFLPKDITRREARRLARFIRSLSWE